MVRHNNMIPNVHLRKHWTKFVRTWFNQPARKRRRQLHRQQRAAALTPRPVHLLRPVGRGQTNRYNNVERLARGFSLMELKEAGLNAQFAKTVGISVDHRRKNRSNESLQTNVKRLQSFVQGLVLYPRTAGKPVKGVIADSSNELVKAAVAQNTNTEVITFPRQSRREKGSLISKELKKVSVYKKLRAAWFNAKFVGVKDKKRQAADAKKALTG